MDEQYVEKRAVIEAVFVPANRIAESVERAISPCGKFQLEVCQYSTGPNTWRYSRGLVTRRMDDVIIADVKRNYGHFWHAWVEHRNGNDYLLCGEDYQGYSVISLGTGTSHIHFPDAGHDGAGFCWTAAHPSPDGLMLAVEGCFWACPYAVVFIDFREPEHFPLPELARIEDRADCEGWRDNETFSLSREIEVRKSDGAEYVSLTDEEQEILDLDGSLTEYRIVKADFTRHSLPKSG